MPHKSVAFVVVAVVYLPKSVPAIITSANSVPPVMCDVGQMKIIEAKINSMEGQTNVEMVSGLSVCVRRLLGNGYTTTKGPAQCDDGGTKNATHN